MKGNCKSDGDKGCQYDYYTYGINHNESKQEIPEQQFAEDFRNIEWYFEDFCVTHKQLGGWADTR